MKNPSKELRTLRGMKHTIETQDDKVKDETNFIEKHIVEMAVNHLKSLKHKRISVNKKYIQGTMLKKSFKAEYSETVVGFTAKGQMIMEDSYGGGLHTGKLKHYGYDIESKFKACKVALKLRN